MGKKTAEVSDTFDTANSIASASIAQVHVAKLRTGEEVVVKVVRPDLKPVIERDVDLMYLLAWFVGKVLAAHAKLFRPTFNCSGVRKST